MYLKKNLFKILSTFLFIIFFSICCFITYLIINKERNPNYKLDSYISHLNNIYKSIDTATYSEEAVLKSLDNIKILQESKKNINTSMKLHETKSFNLLLNSSELYIKQLQHLYSDLNNKNENMVYLKNYYDQIISSLKSLPANSSILNNTINTISKIQNNYESKFYSDKLNSISNLNLNNFINEVNKIMYEFLPLIEDVNEKLVLAREGKYNYQIVLNILDKNINVLNSLTEKISKLPIPQEGLNIYYQIEEILQLYNEYNTKLKYSIKNEQLSESSSLNKEDLKKIYEQTDSMYLNLLNKFNLLKHKLNSKLNNKSQFN